MDLDAPPRWCRKLVRDFIARAALQLKGKAALRLFVMTLLRDLNVTRMIVYECRDDGDARAKIDELTKLMRAVVRETGVPFGVSRIVQ